MRKIFILIAAIIFIVGCSNSFVEDEKFTFTDEEFKDVYEEVNDKNIPTNVTYYPEQMSMENGDKNEAIDFLNATAELLESDEIRRLSESIDNDEENIPYKINGEGFSASFYVEGNYYNVYILPFEVQE